MDHWNSHTAYGHNCLAFMELDLCKPGMASRASALEFGGFVLPASSVFFPLCYRGTPPPLFYSAVLIIGSMSGRLNL